jgi:hypothetical protein
MDMPGNANVNNYYAAWYNTNDGFIHAATKLSGSTSFGSDDAFGRVQGNNSTQHPAGYNFGQPAIATGPDAVNTSNPDGLVYVAWSEQSLSGESINEYVADYIGFASSATGQPGSWTHNYYGIPTQGLPMALPDGAAYASYPYSQLVNSYPSIAVDKSCGPNRGTIYIVAAECWYNESGIQPSTSVISLWWSKDNGNTWFGGSWKPIGGFCNSCGSINNTIPTITVSDPLNNTTPTPGNFPVDNSKTFCWFPAVAVDDQTGMVSVVYYANDGNFANTQTYVAYSPDPTALTSESSLGIVVPTYPFQSIQVSANAQTPDAYFNFNNCDGPPPSAFNPLYWFNELGNSITAYGNHAYPVWQDRGSGLRQIWIADVQYDAPEIASTTGYQDICNPSMAITFSDISKTYDAHEYIDIATCGQDVIIGSTANISTYAGQYIQIGPGFSTQPGAIFTAEIRDDNCQTPGVQRLTKSNPNHKKETISDSINFGMKLYPNPTSGQVTVVAANNNYQNVSFTVTDIAGRSIGQYVNTSLSGNSISQTIDASTYASGLYIVTMIADNQKSSVKFVKE